MLSQRGKSLINFRHCRLRKQHKHFQMKREVDSWLPAGERMKNVRWLHELRPLAGEVSQQALDA